MPPLSSHTTVRAVPHTAVHEKTPAWGRRWMGKRSALSCCTPDAAGPVRRIHEIGADQDHEDHRPDLDSHHDGIGRRALLDPLDQDERQGRDDQYGGQIEGPVYIPKIYNGRDKTFFMFNYERYREGVPQPLTLSVPAPEFLNGDFSKLVDAAGQPVIIYDPRTIRLNPDFDPAQPEGENNLQYIRDPFPGNRIPLDRINPIAQRILGFYRQPNRTDPRAGYARGNLFVSPNLATDSFFNYVIKVDQQFNERHRMYVRYAKNDRTEDRNVNGITDAPGQDGQHPLKRINDAFVVDHLATFSPNFIFNFRASFARYVEGSRGDANVGFDQTNLGFPASLISQLPGTPSFGRYEFGDYASLGRYSGFNYTNTVAVHPSLT